MKFSAATIKDIAKELKVSPSTVSRALHDHPAISSETKKLVSEVAAKLDYHPNVIAFNLKKQRSNTIGVIVPSLAHNYFSSIISGIEDVMFKNGYNLLICQSNEDTKREGIVMETLLANQVDGLLVSVAKNTMDTSHFDKLISKSMPLVFFDRFFKSLQDKVPSVVSDDFNGSYLAVEKLIKTGCRNIAVISAPMNLNIGVQRLTGCQKALEDYNIPARKDFIYESDLTAEDSMRITDIILSQTPRPDGIFVSGGMATKGVLMKLEEKGIVPGKDIKVAGFMNNLYPGHKEPGTIRILTPTYQMGTSAAETLLHLINDVNVKIEITQLAPTLRTD